LIGGRSLNFYLTALSAHASDMSAWLFMGLPAQIFSRGFFESWFAIGLWIFMLLNWLLIAPRIRKKTEGYNSITFSSFFESRFHDTSGMIRIFTSLISLLFYTVYLAAGAIAMGDIIEALFNINYHIGMTIGLGLVAVYLFIGGYRTLAWVDCFQALFLLVVIVAVPLIILPKIGGWEGATAALHSKGLSLSLLPDPKRDHSIISILVLLFSWGIGYFGQPHIVTKFMGIRQPSALKKSMAIGMTWQLIVLSAAIFIGLIGVAFFSTVPVDPEYVFINMVKHSFTPALSAFILCAVLAAILSTMDSQMLVLASSLTEDFYKRLFRKTATPKELLHISRLFVALVAVFVYILSFFRVGGGSIYKLVAYGWSGLGASFGPLLLFGLFSKKTTKCGALSGILTGAIVMNIWFYFQKTSALPAAFSLSSLAIYTVSKLTYGKKDPLEEGV
jgi:solute:Na+ symporter, SSS family